VCNPIFSEYFGHFVPGHIPNAPDYPFYQSQQSHALAMGSGNTAKDVYLPLFSVQFCTFYQQLIFFVEFFFFCSTAHLHRFKEWNKRYLV
jgi:hypothetical protein